MKDERNLDKFDRVTRRKASRVRLRQKVLLCCVGIKRRNVQSVGRAAAGAERGHCLHELRG